MKSVESEGPPRWRVAVAFGVLAVLVIGVCAVSRSPSSPPPATVRSGDALPVGAVPAPGPTLTDRAPPTRPAGGGAGALPGDLIADTAEALLAWGMFASTGRLATVDGTFVVGGPQYERLATEVEILGDTANGAPLYRFILTNPQVGSMPRDWIAVVSATVLIARDGELDREVAWDIEMHWFPAEDRWRLFKATTASVG